MSNSLGYFDKTGQCTALNFLPKPDIEHKESTEPDLNQKKAKSM